MSDKLPFEDAFERKMNDLPAGDENASWDKMKVLLDRKEKRKPFGWLLFLSAGLFIAVLITTGILLSHEKKPSQQVVTTKNKTADSVQYGDLHKQESIKALHHFSLGDTVTMQRVKKVIEETDNNSSTAMASLHKRPPYNIHGYLPNTRQHVLPDKNSGTGHKKSNTRNIRRSLIAGSTSGDLSGDSTANSERRNRPGGTIAKAQNANDSAKATSQLNTATDSIVTNKNDNSKKPALKNDTSILTSHSKTPVKKQSRYTLAAGVQLNQSLPVGGQRITSYNYNGNNNLLYDYIPSVFIKVGSRQWFLQAEFSYASPRFIRPFAYTRITSADYSSGTITTTSDKLQKIYYSQLPVSFNYYVTPHFYAGIGAQLNWFHGAVTQHEVNINDLKIDSETLVTHMVPVKAFTDSFLYKSQAAVLLQAGYTINRWSFSLRYTQGLQSYISFTKPGGSVSNKKISAFQLLVGYSLFSKRLYQVKKVNKL